MYKYANRLTVVDKGQRIRPLKYNVVSNYKIGVPVQNVSPIIHKPNHKPIERKSKSNILGHQEFVNTPINYNKHRIIKNEYQSRSAVDIGKLKNSGKGKILVIIAPGPSVLEVDVSKLNGAKNVDVMTINKPDIRVWPTKYWTFCDNSQYLRNKEAFDSYDGILFNSGSVRVNHKNQVMLKSLHASRGFSLDLTEGVYIGRSTTYFAMQVALWLNYDKIYIYGCDMCKAEINVNGKKSNLLHSYGVNPDVPEDVRIKRFAHEAEFYDYAADFLSKELKGKFYFCSKYNNWPFVRKYNKIDHVGSIDIVINEAKGLGR